MLLTVLAILTSDNKLYHLPILSTLPSKKILTFQITIYRNKFLSVWKKEFPPLQQEAEGKMPTKK